MSASTTPLDININSKQLRFRFPAHLSAANWNDQDPVKSHFWNALSGMLPNTEAFILQVMTPLVAAIQDEKLRGELEGFCRQERLHGKEHKVLNAVIFGGKYSGIKRLEKFDRARMRWAKRLLPESVYAALFAGFEHCTALIAQAGMINADTWFANSHEEVFKIWVWHALEEIEHKAVYYDVYQSVYGRYWARCLAMLLITFLYIVPGIGSRWIYLLYKDGLLSKPSTAAKALVLLLGKTGIVRGLTKEYLSYFSRDFSPWHADTRALLAEWNERIYG
jgi:predicted metal-dependent hydrolase